MKRFITPLLAAMVALSALATVTSAQSFDDDSLTDDHARVLRLYWAFFDRAPETEGAEFWITEINRCRPLKSIAEFFATSDEFVATYGNSISDAKFVEIVYANVLDRAPDLEGGLFWVNEITSGRKSRVDVMLDFAWSDEFTGVRPLPSDGVLPRPCDLNSPDFRFAPTTTMPTTTTTAPTTTTTVLADLDPPLINSIRAIDEDSIEITIEQDPAVSQYLFSNSIGPAVWNPVANASGVYVIDGLVPNLSVVITATPLDIGGVPGPSTDAPSVDMLSTVFGSGWYIAGILEDGSARLQCDATVVETFSLVLPEPSRLDNRATFRVEPHTDPACAIANIDDLTFDDPRYGAITWEGQDAVFGPGVLEGGGLLPAGTAAEELPGTTARARWYGLIEDVAPASQAQMAGILDLTVEYDTSYLAAVE